MAKGQGFTRHFVTSTDEIMMGGRTLFDPGKADHPSRNEKTRARERNGAGQEDANVIQTRKSASRDAI